MAYNFKLQFDINLKSFAENAVAANLWQHSRIKKEVKDYFKPIVTYPDLTIFTPKEKKWMKIVDKVKHNANLLQVPAELLTAIKSILEPIGDKVFYWNLHLIWTLGMKPKYAEKIYWNQFSIIDEKKIFQMYWEKMDDFYDVSKNNPMIVSALFVQENFIRNHLSLLIFETQKYLEPFKIINHKCSPYAIIVIWLCIHFMKQKTAAVEFYKRIKKSKTVAFELFYKCKAIGLFLATKYFWNKLTDAEKQQFYNDEFGKSKLELEFFNTSSHMEEKSLEILIFLINSLPERKRFECVTKFIATIIHSFVNIWPFHKMIEPYIDVVIDNIQSAHQLELLYLCSLQTLSGSNYNRRSINKNLNRPILFKVFPKIPKIVKLSGLLSTFCYLEKLFILGDVPVLSFILNDEELQDDIDDLMDRGCGAFKKMIQSNKMDTFVRFINDLFPLKSQEEKFKIKYNIGQNLLRRGNEGDLACKLLIYLYESDNGEEIFAKEMELAKAKFASFSM